MGDMLLPGGTDLMETNRYVYLESKSIRQDKMHKCTVINDMRKQVSMCYFKVQPAV